MGKPFLTTIKTATVLCLVVVCLSSVLAQSDESDTSPVDTLFEEIELTDEGVYTVDTAGYAWYYDFELGAFVKGVPDRDRPGISSAEPEEIPIEERCTEELKVELFARSVHVGRNEYVDGDIISKGGVTIKGWVKGDVTSWGRRVWVAETGRVDGNIIARRVKIKDGAIVMGEVSEVVLPLPDVEGLARSFSAVGLIVVFGLTIFLLLFALAGQALLPRHTERFDHCLEHFSIKAFFVGLLFLFLMPLVVLLLAITVIGVVVGPIAYILAALWGIIGISRRIGRFLLTKLTGIGSIRALETSVGILAVMLLWFFTAVLLGTAGPAEEGFGILMLVISILISSYMALAGIGAAVLTRFGFRKHAGYTAKEAVPTDSSPAPPPLPESPLLPRSSGDSGSGIDRPENN